jgi:glycosyltransferase involved in cell wall biosynthesis
VVSMGEIQLSYIVAAYNSSQTIEGTLKELAERFTGQPVEIIVVENGSTDGTLDLLRRVAAEWDCAGVELRVLSTEKGLGNAFRGGIAASRGDRVFLGADDLPFGFDDLDAAQPYDHTRHRVVIGSKAHIDSQIDRSTLRRMMTFSFYLLRRAILGMRTRDPQGTFIVDGQWAREVVGALAEPGYLMSTELCYLAEASGIRPVEVPVRLRANHAEHASRIQFGDVWRMATGLFTVRRRHRG